MISGVLVVVEEYLSQASHKSRESNVCAASIVHTTTAAKYEAAGAATVLVK